MKDWLSRFWAPTSIAVAVIVGWTVMLGTGADWEMVSIIMALVVIGIFLLGGSFGRRPEPKRGKERVVASDSSTAGHGGGETRSSKDSNWLSDFFGGGDGGGFDGGGGGDGGGS